MLIELRLVYGKRKLKRTARELASAARLRAVKVMHLTLYGDFQCRPGGVQRIAELIRRIAQAYDRFPFLVNGVWIKNHHDGRGGLPISI